MMHKAAIEFQSLPELELSLLCTFRFRPAALDAGLLWSAVTEEKTLNM